MTTTLLVINTNGNSNEANRVRIVKYKNLKGDPINKYMKRKDAYESDFVFEITDKQLKHLKTCVM